MTDHRTVLAVIDRMVTSASEDVAVRAGDATLTYRELSTRADALAGRLRRLGVVRGSLVGLCVERSASLVVATLAISRAGAAYLATDPAYPDERLSWMLGDAGAVVTVTDVANRDRLPETPGCPKVVLEPGGRLADSVGGEATDPLPEPPGPTDVAYVVYTSGSTGRPKGVVVEHASLANLVDWHCSTFALTAADRCTQIASPGFDATVWEIWPCLAAGAALHVVPGDLRSDPSALRDWLIDEGITVTFLPTAVAEAVIGLRWPATNSLRYLLTGGDALTRRPAADQSFRVVNNYGLSETAVVATSGEISPDGVDAPSIGRAIDGVMLEVVDERGVAVPAGTAGELLVGGAAVARGYLHRPELSAERFITDDRGRWYRTGDRVRRGVDGEVEFLGRLDDQLSIRGFRVEPGEVMAALSSHPAVQASVAVGIGASSGERQLAAFLVPAGSERPDPEQLSQFVKGFLPEYMAPSRYVWVDQLPLTPHGKVDRNALTPSLRRLGPEDVERRPETEIESATAGVVAELLGVDEVGLDENFFLLGGHSMLGAQLVVRLEDRFGVVISLRYLFDHPTPAQLAAEVERQVTAGDPADMVTR